MPEITRRRFLALGAGTAAALTGFGFPAIRIGRARDTPLEHIVLVMQENRSFDHYFGLFPGAEGLPACAAVNRAKTMTLADPSHVTDTARAEYNGGRNDNFKLLGGTRAVTYYTGEDIPYYWALANRFTLCDHYFCSVLGPTFPNRLYSVAASAGGFKDNPPTIDPNLLPRPNLADRLDEANVSWACYIANLPASGFNPVTYYPERRSDPRATRSFQALLDDAGAGRLPAVSWVVTQEPLTEHPPDPISWGERFTALVVNSLASSPLWDRMAVIVNYDENGGFYDHLPPPQVDDRGYGFRVPAIVASPFAKPGHVTSAVLDHVSVIAFVRSVFGLRPVNQREEKSGGIEDAFDFGHVEKGFVSYTDQRRLPLDVTPQGWYASLLARPVPVGESPTVPKARSLCPPTLDLTAGVLGGLGAGAVALAAGARVRSRRSTGGQAGRPEGLG